VMATADLLVLVLRVLPEEIRKWLNAEGNLPGNDKERVGTPESAARIGDLDKHGDRRGAFAPSRPAKKGAWRNAGEEVR
jgi:hypothetical protein